MLAEERRLPYERPPLSKGYLNGVDPASVVYPHDAAWYRDHDVDVRRGVRATSIEPAEHTVSTNGPDAAGQPLRYDRLLLATGSAPRRLDGPRRRTPRACTRCAACQTPTRLRAAFRAGDRRVVVDRRRLDRPRGRPRPPADLRQRGHGPRARRGAARGGDRRRARRRSSRACTRSTASTCARARGVARSRASRAASPAWCSATATSVPADVVVVGIGATPTRELAAGRRPRRRQRHRRRMPRSRRAPRRLRRRRRRELLHPVLGQPAAQRALGQRPERRRPVAGPLDARPGRRRTTTSRTSTPTSTTSAWSTRATRRSRRAPSSSCAATSRPRVHRVLDRRRTAWSRA